ncbi:TPA: hypothetical protein ANIA_11405 [Aspergillus nidulans FGSC A4]|uniref:Uncharacterized protein n=1 Tax=Emericella nidulans (strain FGSC A4 / ATCC 38163 / CBS 112.46 / NRRL 194 / M139) TaxID=227321 RepID=C8V441_EMENI|nr:TPA: hypothetical protein ANIA_11405 [Aspergillus nidulans FGSC A4]
MAPAYWDNTPRGLSLM